MSGTSADGIDAALVDINNDQLHCIDTLSVPFSKNLRKNVLTACALQPNSVEEVKELDQQLAECYINMVLDLLQANKLSSEDIIAIGNHGQTVNHSLTTSPPFSLQIGNAQNLANATKISVVHDFRSADIAAGGQGAPLAPAIHDHLLRSQAEDRVVANLGGIANISILPKDLSQAVTGFDTGPANGLMDYWINKHLGKTYDQNGVWAATGTVNEPLLKQLLDDDYFKLTPPKSTGRELFNRHWLEEKLEQHKTIKSEDVQATLCQLTAESLANDIKLYGTNCNKLIVCGGGSHNSNLLQRIQTELPDAQISNSSDYGIDPDFMEAILFAWLAYRCINNLSGNLPSVTGANKKVILGKIARPSK